MPPEGRRTLGRGRRCRPCSSPGIGCQHALPTEAATVVSIDMGACTTTTVMLGAISTLSHEVMQNASLSKSGDVRSYNKPHPSMPALEQPELMDSSARLRPAAAPRFSPCCLCGCRQKLSISSVKKHQADDPEAHAVSAVAGRNCQRQKAPGRRFRVVQCENRPSKVPATWCSSVVIMARTMTGGVRTLVLVAGGEVRRAPAATPCGEALLLRSGSLFCPMCSCTPVQHKLSKQPGQLAEDTELATNDWGTMPGNRTHNA